MSKRGLIFILLAVTLAACNTSPKTFPSSGSYVSNDSIQLTPNLNIPLEKLVFWGAYAGIAYLVFDPLTPNWSIEEAQLSATHYHLNMHMKRFYAGGAGEARQAFGQRAEDIAHAIGASGFEIVEYSEGIESSVLGSRRTAQGVIRLVGLPAKSAANGVQHLAQGGESLVK